MPAVLYMCDGLTEVDVVPSPKSHRLPPPPGLVVLVKDTGLPVQIVVTLGLNDAIREPIFIKPALIVVSLQPPAEVVISLTLYEPVEV